MWGRMPDGSQLIPMLVGIAILMVIAISLAWVLTNPATTLVAVALVSAAAIVIGRRLRARNRV